MTTTRRHIFIVVLALFICMAASPWNALHYPLSAEEPKDAEVDAEKPITSLAQLNRLRLGVILGTTHDLFADAALDFTNLVYYDGPEQQVEALYNGEIDAVLDDLPVNRRLAEVNPDLVLLPGVLIEDDYAFGMRLKDVSLYERINGELKKLIEDGTVEAMATRWIEGGDDIRGMPDIPKQTAGRFVRFGVSPISPPFCYPGPDGEPIGFEVELMYRIAENLKLRLVVEAMEFRQLIPSLLSEHVDIIGSCLSVTEDRMEILRYTQPVYHGGLSAVVLKDPSLVRKKTSAE